MIREERADPTGKPLGGWSMDATTGLFSTWDGTGLVTSTRPLTGAELAAVQAADAKDVADANGRDLTAKARAALDANATYLGLLTPTAAQTTAQVQRLTRECSAVIRLLLGALDTTSGT